MVLSVGYVHEGQIVNLFNVPDYEIQKETTTAIIGSNGIGKTTLLKTILGEILLDRTSRKNASENFSNP